MPCMVLMLVALCGCWLQAWREEERPVWWPAGMAYGVKGARKEALLAMWRAAHAATQAEAAAGARA